MRQLDFHFPNKYYIETGLSYGDSLQVALDTGLYSQLFSIEIDSKWVNLGRKRFANYPQVRIIEGDSSQTLPSVLALIDAPATFWLDGHFEGSCPILAELEHIRNHHIQTHTILIDDMRSFGTSSHNFIRSEDLIQSLAKINPHYQISYQENGNIMVAVPLPL